MDKILIYENLSFEKDLYNYEIGSEIETYGMIQNTRITKWGGFIILRKAKGLIQLVFHNDDLIIYQEQQVFNLSRESSIRIKGIIQNADVKDKNILYNKIEILVKSIEVLSIPSTENLFDNKASKDNESNFSITP